MKHNPFLGDHPEFQIETSHKLLGQRSRKLIVKNMTDYDSHLENMAGNDEIEEKELDESDENDYTDMSGATTQDR